MMHKVFRFRNVMNMLYSLIIAIPLFSVLVRSAYVTFNKNAYKNYSGELEIDENYIHNVNDLIVDQEYYFKSGSLTSEGMTGGYEQYIEFEYVETISNSTNLDLSQYNALGFYSFGTQVYYYLNVIGETFVTTNYFTYLDNVEFKFIYKDNDLHQNNNILNHSNNIFSVTLLPNGYLDNAFDYALSHFVNENDRGAIDFIGFFDGIFLTRNANNSLYLDFTNWYFNYVLFVSTAYILFLVLMWFVNYCRKILEKGVNYEW